MRLIDCKNYQLREFIGDKVPEYVILSHTWGDKEVTYEDIRDGVAEKRKGYQKLKRTCQKAIEDGYRWVWVDTCCIDKSSSSELQEAINSMYRWYSTANICYVYLSDIKDESFSDWTWFRRSRWFTRGWTLQELIAPRFVEFYAADWSSIGTKLSRIAEINKITGIDIKVLQTCDPGICTIAQRMSWVAHRESTREEDIAYSLMGIFNVNMPMLYGEGGYKAFLRLQEEIIKKTEDHSIFLWNSWAADAKLGALAPSPTRFCSIRQCPICYEHGCRNLVHPVEYSLLKVLNQFEYRSGMNPDAALSSGTPMTMTSRGLQLSLWFLNPQDKGNLNKKYQHLNIVVLNLWSVDKGKDFLVYLPLLSSPLDDTFWKAHASLGYINREVLQGAILRPVFIAQEFRELLSTYSMKYFSGLCVEIKKNPFQAVYFRDLFHPKSRKIDNEGRLWIRTNDFDDSVTFAFVLQSCAANISVRHLDVFLTFSFHRHPGCGMHAIIRKEPWDKDEKRSLWETRLPDDFDFRDKIILSISDLRVALTLRRLPSIQTGDEEGKGERKRGGEKDEREEDDDNKKGKGKGESERDEKRKEERQKEEEEEQNEEERAEVGEDDGENDEIATPLFVRYSLGISVEENGTEITHSGAEDWSAFQFWRPALEYVRYPRE